MHVGVFYWFFFMWYFRQFSHANANVNSSRVRFFGIKICICSVAKLGRDYRPTIQWEERLSIFSSKYIAVYCHGQNAASNSGKMIAMKVLNKNNSNPRVRLGDFVAILTEGRTSTYLPRKQNGHCEPFHRRNRPIQRRDAGSISPATRQRGSHCRIGVQNVVFILDGFGSFGFVVFPISDVFPYFPVIVKGPYPLRARKGRKRGKERGRGREQESEGRRITHGKARKRIKNKEKGVTTAGNRRTNC